MNEFGANTRTSRVAKYRAAVVAFVVVALGGVGFAAGGGAEIVKKLFITVELVGEDGSVFVGNLEPMADGGQFVVLESMHEDGEEGEKLLIELAEGAEGFEAGGTVGLTMTLDEGAPGAAPCDGESHEEKSSETIGGSIQLTTTVDLLGENDAVTAKVLVESIGMEQADGSWVGARRSAGGARMPAERAVVAEIAEPDESLSWVGDDDEWHELSIVRLSEDDPRGSGFEFYLSVVNDDGEDVFALIDTLYGETLRDYDVEQIEITEDGIGMVTFADHTGERFERGVRDVERTMADFVRKHVIREKIHDADRADRD